MLALKYSTTIVFLAIVSLQIGSLQIEAFDDHEDDHDHNHHQNHNHPANKDKGPMPKDKLLLRDVKTLVFQRNKRTSSRRTHSIHQLSCVGGTAGCRMFSPEVRYL